MWAALRFHCPEARVRFIFHPDKGVLPMSVHALRFASTGGPEVLQWQEVELGQPGPGEALVRNHAVGLNYIDTYHRSGLYPLALPSGIGLEGAGVVEAVGEGVTNVAPGDRVSYGTGAIGAYAEARVMPAGSLLKLPDAISFEAGAAMMLKGMTVEYLLHRTFQLKAGQTVLFQAAAGGVGLIAGQWMKAMGVTAIGTAGGAEKCALALANGYSHVIDYNTENVPERVREITGGKGVPVVYDSVGKSTWAGSLDCLAPRGLMVNFGNASGPVDGVNLGILGAKGSIYVTRPSLVSYTGTRGELELSAGRLFDMVASGKVNIKVNQTYPLSEAAQAHRDLEGRKTTGSTVFTV
jgi:NADPH:quinone reductase